MKPPRLPPEYFEEMYAHSADPWQFTTRWYEERKRALTLAALPRPRYRSAFEPGCGIGVLTRELAARCDRILATDIVENALRGAADRLAEISGTVELRRWAIGDDWPAAHFDLIVLSEVCYYLDAAALHATLDELLGHLDPGGTLVCVHWRHPVPEYPLTGDEVHAILEGHPGLARLARYADDDFLLEVYTPAASEAGSVARNEGLI
ncbi:class I SAM-dependent DNA methyltransferase [Nocardia acidivorans]|uniref:class I SAM-dependent DNA methyltransferase n=1 Tax=Nocardia acidivorans TaxID=404580 RepID=UPI0008356103|nr:class I SAM-dependent methyltransferase [Nocardia acidivorans]